MTSAITGGAYSALIRTTTKKLDTALPASFDAALDQARAVREATAQIEGSAGAVNARIINCLRGGTDWRTDKELQGLMFERVAAANGIASGRCRRRRGNDRHRHRRTHRSHHRGMVQGVGT